MPVYTQLFVSKGHFCNSFFCLKNASVGGSHCLSGTNNVSFSINSKKKKCCIFERKEICVAEFLGCANLTFLCVGMLFSA